MTGLRIGQVAELLGVSADTVRRWADDGLLATHRTRGGQRVVDGAALADFVAAHDPAPEPPASSAAPRATASTGS